MSTEITSARDEIARRLNVREISATGSALLALDILEGRS
jgi:hypothetical protein